MDKHKSAKLSLTVCTHMLRALRFIAANENLENQDHVVSANDIAVRAIIQFLDDYFEEPDACGEEVLHEEKELILN